ncbi:MAG: M23 family metallopeptidase [Vallitalea sp.]|jgi:murein DD-endopeptidase MepM/ murein hydrolase activator NlpD|nr:M23 family metallopeptidase [Vallitalea sp.]
MSKDFYNPTRININNPYVGNLTTYGDNWFYTEFHQDGKAVFEVVPSSGLCVNLYIYDRNDNTLAISSNGDEGQVERIEYNVSAGEWIRIDVQYSSGSGSFTLSSKMKSGPTTPQQEVTKIFNDRDYTKSIRKNDDHWYYVQFREDGKANFFLRPNNSSLDVDLSVYEGSQQGTQLGSSSKGAGQADLVSQIPVKAGVRYYIKVRRCNGLGTYLFRCKNYTFENYKAYAIRSYDGKTEVRKEPDFYCKKTGWIGFEEEVTVIGEAGPFSKIEYSAGSVTKKGFVYTKCILPVSYKDKDKNKEKLSEGEWYNPYSDGWCMTQAFNDLDTKFQGHLGHDLVNRSDQSVRAIYHGTVKDAKLSGANGYIVQIEHDIGKKFYSFYSHMEYDLKVKKGDTVEAGQYLGDMGDTGGVPEHLHLGVYTGTYRTSPFGYMAKSKNQHIKDFSESQENNDNKLKAKQNALLKSGVCTRDNLVNTFYDFLEVIRSKGSIIQ